ncbi:hypothetical protein LTR36_005046 [Oleoguttula mirabilis]|uniref:Uncharacterized protein n=1 Tax=Oleoguttula mirabilis TaxID=1507867 RepID=A0AAV9JYN2_9PEZI|nr:hypothetical protein LTR36_005046 [Oleoguttula mirabilis]
MEISQQLRSMSVMSDEGGETDSLLAPHNAWNFHRRERSDIGGFSYRSRHSNRPSLTGIHGDAAGLTRVRSPAASSIYSRPSSIVGPNTGKHDVPHYEVTTPLESALMDWPLQSCALSNAAAGPDESAGHDKPAETGRNDSGEALTGQVGDSPTATFTTATNKASPSVGWVPPREHDISVQSKNSSSNLTTSSKRSRLFGRFSPPKKSVKKRRSIFKFLRPGSRKQQQVRSISSPILRTKPSETSGLYDGPSDDPSLLIVQYELTDNLHQGGRSASVGHLMPRRKDTTALLSVPGMPQRRPSFADYERSLTAAGDDRRRPSAVNVQKLQEVEEDDRRQSMQLRGKLSRAKPLVYKEEPTGIMAQALEKHQQEKALFRSASKQRGSLGPSHEQPTPIIFRTDTLTTSGASSPPPAAGYRHDLQDPSERLDTNASLSRGHGAGRLVPPGAPVAGVSRFASTSMSFNTAASRRASSMAVPPGLAEPRSMSQKIGTTLGSWSRFPSHTRAERCTSAGGADAVIARDFALDASLEDFDTEEDDTDIPKGKRAAKTQSKRLPKRRSTVFGSMMNYYSNMFSSSGSDAAQNRRSSVSAGGWLANPDLELLPPASSHDPTLPHHNHPFKQRLQEIEQQLEDAVRKDVEYVEEEAQKLERELRKDVDYVEDEVEVFEKHIRKDIEYVEEETEKLTHHPHHHQYNQQQANAGSHLFREDGLFADGGHPHLQRDSTFMDPLDDAPETSFANGPTSGIAERNVDLDGAGAETGEPKKLCKAEVWSDLYKECLIPAEPMDAEAAASTRLLCIDGAESHIIEPPSLKPVKACSPEQPKRLDPKASIRRFPSVTVVDDRKGHSRSVSLISVKVEGGSIYRSSTNDLLQLIQAREQEEREKLLRGVDSGVH